jgi:hypothetical protein
MFGIGRPKTNISRRLNSKISGCVSSPTKKHIINRQIIPDHEKYIPDSEKHVRGHVAIFFARPNEDEKYLVPRSTSIETRNADLKSYV